MALRDRTITPGRIGRRPRVEEIRDELDELDRAHLDAWLDDPRVGSKRIATELTAEGYPCSPGAVAHYRRNVLGVDA